MMKENLTRIIQENIQKNWNIQSMSDYKGGSYSFADVARHIARLHLLFRECGIRQGDKVSLVGKNSANLRLCFRISLAIYPGLPHHISDQDPFSANHSGSLQGDSSTPGVVGSPDH